MSGIPGYSGWEESFKDVFFETAMELFSFILNVTGKDFANKMLYLSGCPAVL